MTVKDAGSSSATADTTGTSSARAVVDLGNSSAAGLTITNSSGSTAITRVKVEYSNDNSSYVEWPMQGAAIGGLAVSEAKALSLSSLPFRYVRFTGFTASGTAAFTVAYRGTDASGPFVFAVPGAPTPDAAAMGLVAVTPSDSADLARVTRALWVGVGGDLKVTLVDGTTDELRNIPAGSLLPIAVKRVFATGQTGTIATAVKALY